MTRWARVEEARSTGGGGGDVLGAAHSHSWPSLDRGSAWPPPRRRAASVSVAAAVSDGTDSLARVNGASLAPSDLCSARVVPAAAKVQSCDPASPPRSLRQPSLGCWRHLAPTPRFQKKKNILTAYNYLPDVSEQDKDKSEDKSAERAADRRGDYSFVAPPPPGIQE